MAKENNKKIIALEGEVKTGLKSFAEYEVLVTRNIEQKSLERSRK